LDEEALQRLGNRRECAPQSLDAIATRVADEKVKLGTLKAALTSICGSGDTRADILTAVRPSLRDEDPKIRLAMVKTLGQLAQRGERGDKDLVSLLFLQLEDRDPTVQNAVVQVLRQMAIQGDQDIHGAMKSKLESMGFDAEGSRSPGSASFQGSATSFQGSATFPKAKEDELSDLWGHVSSSSAASPVNFSALTSPRRGVVSQDTRGRTSPPGSASFQGSASFPQVGDEKLSPVWATVERNVVRSKRAASPVNCFSSIL